MSIQIKGYVAKTGQHMKSTKMRQYRREKMLEKNIAKTGEQHHEWKADNASYSAIHKWINKWKGRPKFCENCGSTNKNRYEWANIDHKYRRVLEDYIRLCKMCHVLYDKNKK